jgi:hypothetical protein
MFSRRDEEENKLSSGGSSQDGLILINSLFAR